MNTTDAVNPRPLRGDRIVFGKSLNGISQTRWGSNWKLITLIQRRSCLLLMLSSTLTLSSYGDSKYQFVPEPGAKGQEYLYQMDPMPKGMHTANFKLWIPNSVGKAGKIRGVIAVSGRTRYLYFRHAEIFRSGHWQALASELHLAMFMHNTAEYCSHNHVACSAGIGQPTSDSITAALDHFARTTGHPELNHSGFIFTGRSATGRQALFIANQMPQRTIAMVLYSPASSLPNPLTTTGVPVLINMAGLDLKYANPISLDKKLVLPARVQGAPWAGVFQGEELHGGSGEPSFVMDWVRTIANLRIPEEIPADAPVQLRAINLRDGWLGELKLNSDLNYPQLDGPDAARIRAYTESSETAAAYWLPDEAIAHAWRQYCLRQDATFRHGWSLFKDSFVNSVGMRMMPIPTGRFTMGSPLDEELRADDEVQHLGHQFEPFFLGATEVTQEQWLKVMGTNPSRFKAGNNPVEQVSYEEALKFCQKLSEMDGRKYRLPTEAEWEYACRARTSTPFHYGWSIDAELANYRAEVGYCGGVAGSSARQPGAVAQFIPNDWGLFDMHGNVSEWCNDWYGPYDTKTQGTNLKGPAEGTERVFRGGSFDDLPHAIRSAYRSRLSPASACPRIGLRVVCDSTGNGLLLLPGGWGHTGGW